MNESKQEEIIGLLWLILAAQLNFDNLCFWVCVVLGGVSILKAVDLALGISDK